VEELEAKVLDEFGGLAEHQQELSGLGANVEGLVEKVASVVKRCGDVEALVHRGGNKDIASLRQQLEDLRKRVLVAVETAESARKDVEVSMAPDYSVEDSLELEMCDHVEVVQLTPKHRASGCDDTGGPPANDSAARGIEAGANDDVAATLRKTAMAFGALESLTPSLSTGAVAASGALEPSAIGAKDDGDNDYGHESFEDDMSVPESILDDSQDGSGSER